jgi:hypothetical protein
MIADHICGWYRSRGLPGPAADCTATGEGLPRARKEAKEVIRSLPSTLTSVRLYPENKTPLENSTSEAVPGESSLAGQGRVPQTQEGKTLPST